MAIVNRGKAPVVGLVTATMTFVLTFLGIRWDPAQTKGRSEAPRTDGFRVPLSMSSVLATMHVSTIANLTTVLRFKATIMNQNHTQIAAMMNKLNNEAKIARDSGDAKALLRSTKRLMVMNEALRDRIYLIETRKK